MKCRYCFYDRCICKDLRPFFAVVRLPAMLTLAEKGTDFSFMIQANLYLKANEDGCPRVILFQHLH